MIRAHKSTARGALGGTRAQFRAYGQATGKSKALSEARKSKERPAPDGAGTLPGDQAEAFRTSRKRRMPVGEEDDHDAAAHSGARSVRPSAATVPSLRPCPTP